MRPYRQAPTALPNGIADTGSGFASYGQYQMQRGRDARMTLERWLPRTVNRRAMVKRLPN
jgi:hypothetical protein